MIAPDELDCWKFSSTALAKHLCRELGLMVAPKKLGSSALRLGFLTYRKHRLPAFLLRSQRPHYYAFAQSMDLNKYDYGLFYTPRYCAETAAWFSRRRLGYFSLEDLLLPDALSPAPGYGQLLHEFKATISPVPRRPEPKPFIAPDYKRIVFPDGYVLNLARAHKRRAVVRFIHDQLARSGKDEFDVEVMREEYNRLHPDRPWNSDRFREDLFRNATEDFEHLFNMVDVPLGRYRLKL